MVVCNLSQDIIILIVRRDSNYMTGVTRGIRESWNQQQYFKIVGEENKLILQWQQLSHMPYRNNNNNGFPSSRKIIHQSQSFSLFTAYNNMTDNQLHYSNGEINNHLYL